MTGAGTAMSGAALDAAIALVLLGGIGQFRTPGRARWGNGAAALSLLAATVLVLWRHGTASPELVAAGAVVGAAAGWWLASRVAMIHIPPMVGLQNGLGGLAACLVSWVELSSHRAPPLAPIAAGAAILGLLVGAATFSGSLVAAGKLLGRLRSTPVVLPRHGLLLLGLGVASLAAALGLATAGPEAAMGTGLLAVLSLAGGAGLALRVGGADMPVLISFLNALSGLAAALCGLTVGHRLLIVCGATVAASGLVLTRAMCRAMNRDLGEIFTGRTAPPTAVGSGAPEVAEVLPVPGTPTPAAGAAPATAEPVEAEPVEAAVTPAASSDAVGDQPRPAESGDALERAVALLREARSVVIIPGYGMALADAQRQVVELADSLAAMDKDVSIAIHPVAGRMPGHMHVLLAEAEVDYDMISELEEANDAFAASDVALVVGACDVVNPAAMAREGTPISGMPILKAHEAASAIVCNLDAQPGYSGVENPLYREPGTVLLLGDAAESVGRLLAGLAPPSTSESESA